ncbi:hypothetical protein [Streptococcus phage LF1]|nr:hypothetical protein [Streptococcus phage LF1]AYJ75041.1 hypothetical protein [Streptococcus phage LF4]
MQFSNFIAPKARRLLRAFHRNSRNRTDTYNQTVDNPIIKALPLPFSNHGSCPNGLVLLCAKVPVEIPVLIFKVSL